MEKVILSAILSAASPQFGDCDTAKGINFGNTFYQFNNCSTIESEDKKHRINFGQIPKTPFPINMFKEIRNDNEPLCLYWATESCAKETNSHLNDLLKSSICKNIFNDIKNELLDYSDLENNWDNNYAVPISKQVIKNTIDFAKILDKDDLLLLKDTSMPNQNGTITFLVNDEIHNVRLSLEIGDKFSNYYISNSDGIIKSSDTEFDVLKKEDVTEMFTFYKSLKNK